MLEGINTNLEICNDKATQYFKRHGTVKGFYCEFEIRNCLNIEETKYLMRNVSPNIKLLHDSVWTAPYCHKLIGKPDGTQTIWDASYYSGTQLKK